MKNSRRFCHFRSADFAFLGAPIFAYSAPQAKALRDLRTRAVECGAETTEAEKSAWANALRALVSRAQSQAPAPDETAGKGSRSAPAKPSKIPRLSALDLLTALGIQLEPFKPEALI